MLKEKFAQKIIDTCLKMNQMGLNQGSSGNVSMKYDHGILITPSGVDYHQLSIDQIVYIDQQGIAEKGKKPSSEWQFHLSCYHSRPELNAVIHTHSVHATALAILNKSIPAIHYMIAVSGADCIPCIPYAIFGSTQLADYVAQGIKKSKAILMQHHGLLAIEHNLDRALYLVQEIETLAKMYLLVLATGEKIPTLNQQEMDKVLEKFKDYGIK